MERIGVRELRQHASRYLARVADGETIEVTDRGRPIALLTPMPKDPLQALVDSGVLVAPIDAGGLLAEEPEDYGIDASAELAALRADRSLA
jgi:prevent-host-death family protein